MICLALFRTASPSRPLPLISFNQLDSIGAKIFLYSAITSSDAIIFDFWPIAAEYGWYEAFNQVFSMTTEEFYEEYENFLRLPFNEQINQLSN